MGSFLSSSNKQSIKAPVLSFWELAARDIDQNLVQFRNFKGKKAILIVNVASQSKYTDSNYKQLNEMYEQLSGKGLQILAFPCNQFQNAQKQTNQQIKKFANETYNIKFPLFQKSLVNTQDLHPVYAFVRQNSALYDQKEDQTRKIEDNFTIFVINSEGKVVKYFKPSQDLTPVKKYVESLIY